MNTKYVCMEYMASRFYLAISVAVVTRMSKLDWKLTHDDHNTRMYVKYVLVFIYILLHRLVCMYALHNYTYYAVEYSHSAPF